MEAEDLAVQEDDVFYSILEYKDNRVPIVVPKAIRLISEMNETLATMYLEKEEMSLMNEEAYNYLLDWYTVTAMPIFQEDICAVALKVSEDILCVDVVELAVL